MRAVGVKSPLTRAVITQNLGYSNAEDMYQYLSNLFNDDATKSYSVLSSEEISQCEVDNSPLVIGDCRKLHMTSFFPDGSIQSKVNVCSCGPCMEGEFTSCLIEKAKNVEMVDEASDDD